MLATHLGNQENTRCLGNYLVKGGYKEFDDLNMATQEPIIAEPDIHGGITIDETCQFLLLMSAGLYKSVEEATRTDQVNKYIAQCVVEQVYFYLHHFSLNLHKLPLILVQRASHFNGSCTSSG